MLVGFAGAVAGSAWGQSAGSTRKALVHDLPVANPTPSKRSPPGTYQIVPQINTGNVWVLDAANGALPLCTPPRRDGPGTPKCLPWGDATK